MNAIPNHGAQPRLGINTHSPLTGCHILEGQYIAEYSHAKQTNDNL